MQSVQEAQTSAVEACIAVNFKGRCHGLGAGVAPAV
jgi:hypothetical protein